MNHSSQCWSKAFLFIYLNFCYYRCFCSFCLQGSVETHLSCGGIYNNRIIANCLQNVPVKEFWKLVNSWRRYVQK